MPMKYRTSGDGFLVNNFSLNKDAGSSMTINRVSPVDARKQMDTARAMTNSGIEFVCVPVHDGNRIEVRVLAMSALDKLISEAEGK